jgi:hypothetical protein
MARYQHLPIYKTGYELLGQVVHVTKDFPREFKFTIGQRLRDEVIEVLVLVYRANNLQDKFAVLSEILERVLVIELMIRLCHDMRILARKHYAGLVMIVESLARQAEGWKKSATKLS